MTHPSALRRRRMLSSRSRAWLTSVVLACVGANALHAAPRPILSRPAPALVAPAMAGGTVDLAALRGHVVVLNLWASWCPPCRAELPMLAHLQSRHRDEGLVLIALSADRHRDRTEAKNALNGLDVTGAFMDGAAANGYANPEVLPVTYVIDRAGVLRAEFLPGNGALSEAQLEAALTPLLIEAPPGETP